MTIKNNMKKYIKPTCTLVAIKSMSMCAGSQPEPEPEPKDPLDLEEYPEFIWDGGA